MGEELGNYRSTEHHTVHANPPVEFRDRQTDRVISGQTDTHITLSTPTPPVEFRDRQRETVYMGEELGNYVHQNFSA